MRLELVPMQTLSLCCAECGSIMRPAQRQYTEAKAHLARPAWWTDFAGATRTIADHCPRCGELTLFDPATRFHVAADAITRAARRGVGDAIVASRHRRYRKRALQEAYDTGRALALQRLAAMTSPEYD